MTETGHVKNELYICVSKLVEVCARKSLLLLPRDFALSLLRVIRDKIKLEEKKGQEALFSFCLYYFTVLGFRGVLFDFLHFNKSIFFFFKFQEVVIIS